MVFVYIIFIFLVIRFTVTLFNFISNPKLTTCPYHNTDFISILIPARNEQHNIRQLLMSIHEQNYTNYEVIILDDNSEDDTLAICREFCSVHERFSVYEGKPLPTGWLGKNYACHQLAALAKGKYFLFIDADEEVMPDLLNNSIHRMKLQKLALLSLFTDQVMTTLGEKCVVPLMHYLLLSLLPLRLVKLSPNASLSAASGQFMLFDAANYQDNKWHEQVKDKVVEDIEIMKLLKSQGFMAETLLANGGIKCRMYTGYGDAITGFSKNLLAGFNNSIPALLFYLLFVVIGPFFMLFYLDLELLLFAVNLIVLLRIMISLLSRQHILLNIVLHPLQMLTLVFIGANAIRKTLTRKIIWKGRSIHP